MPQHITPEAVEQTARHTPGPWQTIGTDPSAGFDCFDVLAQPSAALRGFTKHIATVDGYQSDPERLANARLIAAAPELLTALYRAREILERNKYATALEEVNAAISKARGEAA